MELDRDVASARGRRRRALDRRPRPGPPADPGDAARGTRPARAGRTLVQGDRRDPRRLARPRSRRCSSAPAARSPRSSRTWSRAIAPSSRSREQTDGRLGRKERKRLDRPSGGMPELRPRRHARAKRRRAFKGLALLPLPLSLTLFKGAPSASAAVGLPTIGGGAAAGTAAGVGAGAVTAKIAIGVAAVAVAGGAGYEGAKVVRDPATLRPAGEGRARRCRSGGRAAGDRASGAQGREGEPCGREDEGRSARRRSRPPRRLIPSSRRKRTCP